MSSELAVIQAAEWEILTAQAKALVQSGFLPKAIDTPQKAVAIIMLGRELGIAPWASMSSINVIQGKPSVSPQLMLALINRSGQLEDMLVDGDERQCSVTMKRKGRAPHTESFSIDEARKMNVTGKPTWQSIPGTMLKWRAVAACARVVFPDVILGLYTPDEMGADVAVDETGNMEVVEVAREPLTLLPAATPPEESTPDNPLEWDDGEETPPNLYTVQRMKIQPMPNNSHMYVLDFGGTNNITFYGGDKLREAGVDVDAWKQQSGKWKELNPPLKVQADFENGAWVVHAIEKVKAS